MIKLILLVSGLTLIAFGFVHILLLDKLFLGKSNYLRMKWWVGKITLGLTIIFFASGVIMLINVLFNE
jgi:hypothetical protein